MDLRHAVDFNRLLSNCLAQPEQLLACNM